MGRTKEVTAMSNSNKRKLEEDKDTPFGAKRKNLGTTESTAKKMEIFKAISNSMISSFVDNPGYYHITQKILLLLSHNEQLKCRFVGKSWKKFIDKPRFWIKKLEQKGQTKDLHDEWMDLVQRIEQDSEMKKNSENDSEMEKHVTTCLKAWHKGIHHWKKESLAGMLPIHIASGSGNNKLFRFIAAYVENPNPKKCDGFTPLHLAAEFGNTKIIKFLVSQIENINDVTPNG